MHPPDADLASRGRARRSPGTRRVRRPDASGVRAAPVQRRRDARHRRPHLESPVVDRRSPGPRVCGSEGSPGRPGGRTRCSDVGSRPSGGSTEPAPLRGGARADRRLSGVRQRGRGRDARSRRARWAHGAEGGRLGRGRSDVAPGRTGCSRAAPAPGPRTGPRRRSVAAVVSIARSAASRQAMSREVRCSSCDFCSCQCWYSHAPIPTKTSSDTAASAGPDHPRGRLRRDGLRMGGV